MYQEFFGFSEEPFGLTPDPAFLCMTRSHWETFSAMMEGIREKKGIIVITGDVGTGKTNLVHALLKDLSDKVKTAFVINPHLAFKQLLKTILEKLDVPVGGQNTLTLLYKFDEYIRERSAADETVVILIDEAQVMTPAVLVNLDRLLQRDAAQTRVLQTILVGQPELEAHLDSEGMRQFKQRIAAHSRIRPLNREEAEAYINHRLKKVGSGSSGIFTPEALQLICDAAKGIPRVINLICGGALLAGYITSTREIGIKQVWEAIVEDAIIAGEEAPRATEIAEEEEKMVQEVGEAQGDFREEKKKIAEEKPGFARAPAVNIEAIDHHIELVGSRTTAVFTPGALSLICRRAKGIPRRINSICDKAFWVGYQRLRKRIDLRIVREAFNRICKEKGRYFGIRAFGERLVIREIPRAVRQAFSRVYEGRKRFSGVWAFARNFLSKPVPYFIPLIICLVVGIFLGKDIVKNISEKTVAHLIVPQKAMPPIIERKIEEPARNFLAPSPGKIVEKVPVPAREKNTNIFTRTYRPQDLERTEPMTELPSAAEKVPARMSEKEIEEPSLKNPTPALEKIEPKSSPGPLIASRKEEPQELRAKGVSQAAPSIIHAFASKQISPGGIWKIYLKASHPNEGMEYIFGVIESGGSGSHLSITNIKEENRKHFSGYIYLNTSSMSNSLRSMSLKLTIWIKDAAGHFSQPMVFLLELQNNILSPEKPPQGLFEEQDLGPIMVKIQSLTETGG